MPVTLKAELEVKPSSLLSAEPARVPQGLVTVNGPRYKCRILGDDSWSVRTRILTGISASPNPEIAPLPNNAFLLEK